MSLSEGLDLEGNSPTLTVNDANLFLEEQVRSMNHIFSHSSYGASDKGLRSLLELKVCVAAHTIQKCCQHFSDGVDYVESLLRKQLIAAIGKELSPVDFTYYMEFHNRNIFKEEYGPVPFSYAVCIQSYRN